MINTQTPLEKLQQSLDHNLRLIEAIQSRITALYEAIKNVDSLLRTQYELELVELENRMYHVRETSRYFKNRVEKEKNHQQNITQLTQSADCWTSIYAKLEALKVKHPNKIGPFSRLQLQIPNNINNLNASGQYEINQIYQILINEMAIYE